MASKNQRFIPLVEVKLDNRDLAVKIRKQFSAKKREIDFGKIFIANSVTLGTRVRVDILKSIAELYSNEKESMSVSAFVSRPVLHVRPKDAKTRPMWLSFSDSLVRFGSGLGEGDLGDAYRRAGVAFKGQLQQNFVVLHEEGAENEGRAPPKAGTSASFGTPKKRVREDLGAEPESKTPRKRDESDGKK